MSIIDPTPVTFRTRAPEINDDPSSAGKKMDLQFDQFIKILVGELSNQDPTNPVDNAQFLTQLSTLQNLETMSRLEDSLGAFMKYQKVSSAAVLIGHEVSFINSETGEPVTGLVEKVVLTEGNVTLVVDGINVAFENVHEIL